MELPEALKAPRIAYKAAADTDDPTTRVTLSQEVAFVLVHWHMAAVRLKQRQSAAINREHKRAKERAARKVERLAKEAARQAVPPFTMPPTQEPIL